MSLKLKIQKKYHILNCVNLNEIQHLKMYYENHEKKVKESIYDNSAPSKCFTYMKL